MLSEVSRKVKNGLVDLSLSSTLGMLLISLRKFVAVGNCLCLHSGCQLHILVVYCNIFSSPNKYVEWFVLMLKDTIFTVLLGDLKLMIDRVGY